MNEKEQNEKIVWMMTQCPFPEQNVIEYDGRFEGYDGSKESLDLEALEADHARIVRIFKEIGIHDDLIKPNIACLDVGIGPGGALDYLSSANENGIFYGIEPEKRRFDFATKILKNKKNVFIRKISLEKVNFMPESFDYIISTATLEHLRDPYLLISNANKWLKQNGKLLITCPNVDGLHPKLLLSKSLIHKWRCAVYNHHWLTGKKSVFRILELENFKIEKFFTYGGFSAPRNLLKEIGNKLLKLFNMGDILVLLASKKGKI